MKIKIHNKTFYTLTGIRVVEILQKLYKGREYNLPNASIMMLDVIAYDNISRIDKNFPPLDYLVDKLSLSEVERLENIFLED